ncbi:MAG: protein-L-isoaspartate O-methyltransferase [Hyphomicrobiales bacterium]|nr:protein-L-isoaspartate O-methyltransferase [Hyphomicrobiales bacterium]
MTVKLPVDRRQLLIGAAAGAAAFAASPALANVPLAHDSSASPPRQSRDAFVEWMAKNRGEDPKFLGQRWDRLQQLIAHNDVWDEADIHAFLLTPREEFVTAENLDRAYEWHHLNIGFGVTITGPHTVARMTNTLAIKRGDKVLEIGTGSGYQSAYLSNLTPNVWSIEIIPPLAKRTRALYDNLIARGYGEYRAIRTRNADGYYGWEENAPFDKIIVTCGIDHIPPPLLQQLVPDGIMVIPVGPPGAQHVLKAVKRASPDGQMSVARSDIYGGAIIPFVPFTGSHQS